MRFRWLAGLLLAGGALAQSYSDNADTRLAAYVAEALENNPAVRESFSRYQAARQRLPQVSALPDPMLGFTQFVRSPETRVGPQTAMLSISQRFPWFGKLSDQEQAAAKEAAVMAALHEAAKAETGLRVKLAYYELAHADRAIVVTQEEVELLRHFETLAQARYAQGVGLQQSAVKLQAEITRGLSRLEMLRRQRIDAESALNTLRDQTPGAPLETAELRAPPKVVVDFDRLYTLASQHRPELQAAFLQIESEEKRIHLARKQYWPDVTLEATFTNVTGRNDLPGILMPPPDNGKNVYGVRAAINLPIYRRKYDAGVLEATEQFAASKQGYRHKLNQTEAAIRSAGYRLESLERQISLFEDLLLPQAEQSLNSAEAAYATGGVAVLDLLDSERTLFDVRLGLARLLSDAWKTMAELERAAGVPIPEAMP